MVDRKDVTQESFTKMSPAEKTEFLGYKIYTPEELEAREKDKNLRAVNAFRFILESIIALKDLKIGAKATEQDLADTYQNVTNNFYAYAVDNGLSASDVKEVGTLIQQITSIVVARTVNEIAVDMMRFNFAMSGENEVFEIPVKRLVAIAEGARQVRAEDKTA